MTELTRRALLSAGAVLAAGGLGGCVSSAPSTRVVAFREERPRETFGDAFLPDYEAMYGPITTNERFPIARAPLDRINPEFLRRQVDYSTPEPVGTIVVDPRARYLYLVQERGRAMRYGVGVGREGFSWSGDATINSKQEWPDWYPPQEMIERQPEIRAQLSELRSGMGVAGGLRNPLGARALYLWQNGRDTLYRIHGTTEPWTIGRNVSSGCIRMINQDAVDLYNRVPVGTRVVVLNSPGGQVARLG
jgi:lipoprotein-anchoring transpeptidase ErfK/SrfK